jgi:hypothetical protein
MKLAKSLRDDLDKEIEKLKESNTALITLKTPGNDRLKKELAHSEARESASKREICGLNSRVYNLKTDLQEQKNTLTDEHERIEALREENERLEKDRIYKIQLRRLQRALWQHFGCGKAGETAEESADRIVGIIRDHHDYKDATVVDALKKENKDLKEENERLRFTVDGWDGYYVCPSCLKKVPPETACECKKSKNSKNEVILVKHNGKELNAQLLYRMNLTNGLRKENEELKSKISALEERDTWSKNFDKICAEACRLNYNWFKRLNKVMKKDNNAPTN